MYIIEVSVMCSCSICTELIINFREADYSITEGQMNSAIVLQLRSIQNPFTVEIYPVSIETASTHFDFGVDMFIQLEDTTVEATEGKSH